MTRAALMRAIGVAQRRWHARAWRRDQGDRSLRLDYDLTASSTVVDLGGYHGDWTTEIWQRYEPAIHVFEPVAEFARHIEQRFAGIPQIAVHPFGLSNRTERVVLHVAGDRSSTHLGRGEPRDIPLVRAAEAFEDLGIDQIDLLKVNIEGGEYDLIEHLVETGLIANVRDLQVQFHEFVPNARRRMRHAHRLLDRTHEPTYRYPFVWESWRRKAPVS